MTPLRVALFTDSFREPNGVATLSREYAAFTQRRQIPFLCVHSGQDTQVSQGQSLTTIELKRGPAAFPLDRDLYCDPFLSRYKHWITTQVKSFRADLVHITGPGDMSILGFWVAHCLRIPLVASWHTNLHQYAALRLDKLFAHMPASWRAWISNRAERHSLWALIRFYRLARFLFAPNDVTVQLLKKQTGRPAFLMGHGVDPQLFSPRRRTRQTGSFCIGYVGRLTPEKNVRLFASLEQGLLAAGECNFRLLMVGDGSEREWLRNNLRYAEFPGTLRGAALAEAFANMDVFVFPSRTDTFGLVLLEAMASGVPVVLSPESGVRVGVGHGITGFHAESVYSFTESVLSLIRSQALRSQMACAARRFASLKDWSGVFDELHETYQLGLDAIGFARSQAEPLVPPPLG